MSPLSGDSVNNICVGLFNPLDQSWDFLGWMLQVVVHGYHQPSASVVESAHQGIVLPEIPHQLNSHDGIFRLPLNAAYRVPGIIGTGVVDEDELPCETRSIESV
jgi:hypothetical protein